MKDDTKMNVQGTKPVERPIRRQCGKIQAGIGYTDSNGQGYKEEGITTARRQRALTVYTKGGLFMLMV